MAKKNEAEKAIAILKKLKKELAKEKAERIDKVIALIKEFEASVRVRDELETHG